jgi:hypothetical protein
MDWNDERWSTMQGGYRIPLDPRPLLLRLRSDPFSNALWDELISELYHQGDVGEASYAAATQLVNLFVDGAPLPWQVSTLVCWIESARTSETNPPLPPWIERDYYQAIETLALRCLRELGRKTTPDQTRGMLAIIAIWKNLPIYARALVENSEDELAGVLPN